MDISHLRELIEERIKLLLSPNKIPSYIYEPITYYPLQKGKRIRPLLLTLTTYYLGGNIEDAITVGCSIEIIHNYSLIHDDLPAMDNDDFRRGKPTCHKKYGEANAILSGDALLTYAFQILSERNLFKSLQEKDLIDIINVISRKAGIQGMVLGQFFDINGYEDPVETNMYKTAALFEACFVCGGIVAGRRDIIKDLENLGRNFGLLFQFTDDILDKDGVYKKDPKFAIREVRRLREETIKMLNKTIPDGEEIRNIIELVTNRIGSPESV